MCRILRELWVHQDYDGGFYPRLILLLVLAGATLLGLGSVCVTHIGKPIYVRTENWLFVFCQASGLLWILCVVFQMTMMSIITTALGDTLCPPHSFTVLDHRQRLDSLQCDIPATPRTHKFVSSGSATGHLSMSKAPHSSIAVGPIGKTLRLWPL